jgi:hypothetical protein
VQKSAPQRREITDPRIQAKATPTHKRSPKAPATQ